MEKPFLLHIITPEKNISPFDANMSKIQFSQDLHQHLKEQVFFSVAEILMLQWT